MELPSSEPPSSSSIYQEIDWTAPSVDVCLRVELPFWLMTGNGTFPIDINGHTFPVSVSEETFELHVGDEVSDSKIHCVYHGPIKKRKDLSKELNKILQNNKNISSLWRKCKTVLRISSRCNGDVWDRYSSVGTTDKKGRSAARGVLSFYLAELCRAHIPVANKLIQAYRLATYDYFPYEIAPWDVPTWYVQRDSETHRCLLVPYRGWDHRPVVQTLDGERTFYQLIDASQLQGAVETSPTPGELELLDALNLMERGDYSGAVRRASTAIEVIVEDVIGCEIEKAEGRAAAQRFLNQTRMRFPARIKKYEALSGRSFSLTSALEDIRNLRNRIVHDGHRIAPGERGTAQHMVDRARWIFNWFEDDELRRKVREGRIAFRSLGRDSLYGIFRSEITSEGVVVSPPSLPPPPPPVPNRL